MQCSRIRIILCLHSEVGSELCYHKESSSEWNLQVGFIDLILLQNSACFEQLSFKQEFCCRKLRVLLR